MSMCSETRIKGDALPFFRVLQKPVEVVMMLEAEKLPNVLETQAATSGKAGG